MRSPLVIYDFATAPFWKSLFMIKNFFFISECYDDLKGWKPGGWVKPGRLTVWLASPAAEGSVCTCLFCCLNSHALGSAGSNTLRNVRDEKRRDNMFDLLNYFHFHLWFLLVVTKDQRRKKTYYYTTGPMYFVFCRRYPFSPQPPRQCLGPSCHLSTLN